MWMNPGCFHFLMQPPSINRTFYLCGFEKLLTPSVHSLVWTKLWSRQRCWWASIEPSSSFRPKPWILNLCSKMNPQDIGLLQSLQSLWVRHSATNKMWTFLSDSRFLSRRNQYPLHRQQGELWRHRGLQVRVPHVLRHGLLLLPLLRHHDPRAQQQGPASRHPKWVRKRLPPAAPSSPLVRDEGALPPAGQTVKLHVAFHKNQIHHHSNRLLSSAFNVWWLY